MRETLWFFASLAGAAVLTALAVILSPQSPVWRDLLFGGGYLLLACAVLIFLDMQQPLRERPKMIPLIGMVVFGLGFLGCAVLYYWPSDPTTASVSQSPNDNKLTIPKNAGIINAKPGSVIFSQGRPLNRLLEIGTSGAVFNYVGAEGSPLFSLFDKYNIIMEMVDGKLKVSTKVGNDKGELLAELIRNEWKVAPPPSTFDRNYSDDALEVKGASGRIVLQVRVLPDRVQLQGEWWDRPGFGVRMVKSNDPAHPGALIMRFWPTVQPGPPDIVPMFVYPSELHLGEVAKP
jgi:hypothetical protein